MMSLVTTRDDYMHPLPVSRDTGTDEIHCYTDGETVTLPRAKMSWALRDSFRRVLSFYGRNTDFKALNLPDLGRRERNMAQLLENGRMDRLLATHEVGLKDLEAITHYVFDHDGFACIGSTNRAFVYTLVRVKREAVNCPDLKAKLAGISHRIAEDLPPRLIHDIDTLVAAMPRVTTSVESVDLAKKVVELFDNHSQ